ncbi:Recombination endonuclease VII [compost metagenome]
MAVLTQKNLQAWKQTQFDKQHGKCALCDRLLESVQKANADHQHFGNGHMRGLLCPGCNVFEGRIQTLFYRAGLANVDWSMFCESLARYWKQDYSNNPTHPIHVADTAKRFGKITSRQKMIEALHKEGITYVDRTYTREQLIDVFKKEYKKRLA